MFMLELCFTDIKDTDPIGWRVQLWDRGPEPDGDFTLKSFEYIYILKHNVGP